MSTLVSSSPKSPITRCCSASSMPLNSNVVISLYSFTKALVTIKSCMPSVRGFWKVCLPTILCFTIVSPISKAGLIRMRSVPLSNSAYMPPIDVPMMRSGFSASHVCFNSSKASAGCKGRSGAMTVAAGISVRKSVTVPDWPDEPKP